MPLKHKYEFASFTDPDGGHRVFNIIRGDELVLGFRTDEHLLLFFKRLVVYLNREYDDKKVAALEDRVILLENINKSLVNLFRITTRKIGGLARLFTFREQQDYGKGIADQVRKAVDEIQRQIGE